MAQDQKQNADEQPAEEAPQSIDVDPMAVIAVYQQRLATVTHENILLRAQLGIPG